MEIINWQVGFSKLEIESVVAIIGNFDGVHIGHKKLINDAQKTAQKSKLKLAIMTFEPHPRMFFSKASDNFLIQSKDDKIKELSKLQIDYFFNIKFDSNLSSFRAEEFIKEILHNKLNIKHVVVGKDFLFGKNREGNISTLQNIGEKINLKVSTIEIVKNDNFKISSTKIRELIREGNVELANKYLGRNFSISGQVIHGDKIGKKINFPTANIKLLNHFRPAFGVYAVNITSNKFKNMMGIANIGNRPTVNYVGELLEAHIFDENIDLYDETISVEFLKFIRPEKKFNGIDDLKKQILLDEKIVREFFKNL